MKTNWKRMCLLVACLMMLGGRVLGETPEVLTKPVLPANALGGVGTHAEPRFMMFRWLRPQVEAAEKAWREAYELRKTPEEIAAYQKTLKEKFIENIGDFPDRTPLNAKITGRLERNGFVMEKVLFESQPGLYVTGVMFLPDEAKFPKPWPGVLISCGHSYNGKGYVNYQRVAALHALNGMAAFLVDPIDQGERFQLVDLEKKKELAASVHAHNLIGIGSILLGWNTARYEIWDLMRGLDYLQSREDVQKGPLGAAGLSGGGTQTAYLMALDDRVSVAASCCYLCSLFGLMQKNDPQDAEQNIFGQSAWGMDHADYCMMRAPKPTLIGSATKDFFPIEMTWDGFRYAKRLFQRMGYGENIDLAETDNTHGYDKTLREATVRFMLRFLAKREEAIFEPDEKLEVSDAEIRVTKEGLTLLEPGARSTYDLNRDEARRLAEIRAKNPLTDETLAKIRELASIRKASDLPEVQIFSRGEKTELTEGIVYETIVFQPEKRILLPALRFSPQGAEKAPQVIYVNDRGKTSAWETDILPMIQAGKSVLAVDLRGWGETQQVGQKYFNPKFLGSDGKDFYTAYNLGKTYVGYRTEDILGLAKWLKNQPETASVEIHAVSEGCIPCRGTGRWTFCPFNVVGSVGFLDECGGKRRFLQHAPDQYRPRSAAGLRFAGTTGMGGAEREVAASLHENFPCERITLC
ncbi:MAG: alpha/beta hydrolase family protein [Planctomycetia bacterium]|nr:alpha/beta hydrolase family protein [Planctomycetia bacterium]